MEWWLIFLFLLAIYIAYSAGHWIGYGKGEQDTRELRKIWSSVEGGVL